MSDLDQDREDPPESPTPQAGMPQDSHADQPPLDAPGHDPYAVSGANSITRPGSVTAAVVLGFLFASLDGLIGLSTLPDASTPGGQFQLRYGAVALLGLCSSVMYVWGGIAALVGRGRILHLVASGMNVALGLLALFLLVLDPGTGKMSMMVVPTMFVVTVLLVFVVTTVILILLPSSTEFFRAHRGRVKPPSPAAEDRPAVAQRRRVEPSSSAAGDRNGVGWFFRGLMGKWD